MTSHVYEGSPFLDEDFEMLADRESFVADESDGANDHIVEDEDEWEYEGAMGALSEYPDQEIEGSPRPNQDEHLLDYSALGFTDDDPELEGFGLAGEDIDEFDGSDYVSEDIAAKLDEEDESSIWSYEEEGLDDPGSLADADLESALQFDEDESSTWSYEEERFDDPDSLADADSESDLQFDEDEQFIDSSVDDETWEDEGVNDYLDGLSGEDLLSDSADGLTVSEEQESGTKIVIKHPHFPAQATIDATKARLRNRRFAKRYKWGRHRKKIEEYLLEFLGWDAFHSREAFAIGIANWQIIWGLKVTGTLNRRTWIYMKSLMCMGYLPGEVRKSRTSRGHLEQDVSRYKGHLLIADFGVNRSNVKKKIRSDPLLRTWLQRFEKDTTYRLLIGGFSDCVGGNRNRAIRLARAKAVFKLLGPSARSRSTVVAARFDDKKRRYIELNHTPYGRARNRSVQIFIRRDLSYAPDHIQVKPPTLREICDNARRVLDNHRKAGVSIDKESLKRLRCVLDMMKKPNVDDRVILLKIWHAQNYGPNYKKPLPKAEFEKLLVCRFRDFANRNLYPGDPARSIISSLEEFDFHVLKGVLRVNAIQSGGAHLSEHSPGNQVTKWIRGRQKDPKSLYRCYRG